MLKFEIKKFCCTKKNFIILVIFCLLLIVTHFFYLNSTRNIESIKPNMIEGIKYGISKAEESLQKPEYPEDLKADTKNRILMLKGEKKALESNRFNDYFDIENKLNESNLKYNKDEKQLKEQNQVTQQSIDYYNLVKSRNLDFELQPGAQMHAFGSFISLPLSSMFTSMYLLIFSVLVSVQISSHFESKEFLFYDFAKISRRRTLLHKCNAALTVTFGWILLISAIDIVIVGFMDGFGSLNYPGYLKNPSKTAMESTPGWKIDNMAIPNGEIILISILYLLLILIFLATLGALLSTLFKRSLVVVGTLAVLIVGWSLVADEKSIQFIRPYVPMSYLNPIELLCYPFYLFGKNSLMVGVVYLLVLSVVCYFAAGLMMKNYKVRRT